MKSFLYLILLFGFQSAFAQSEQFKHDSTNIQNKISKSMIVNIVKEKYHSDSSLLLENKKSDLTSEETQETSSKKESNTEKSNVAENINIVQEINTVLNYRINRIWRQDLYCLVCVKNYNSERAA